MAELRQLVQEEGREARNLIAFHVAVDPPGRPARKPPRSAAPRAPPRAPRRSASAGRDKRTELRARYWALLFGDLQRAVGEIYNTVEAHENLSECQEVILVLENYTRDFKALCEWFRLKWEYDNTPPPQRPQSLAWEIRKTDFVRPDSRRGQSVKSSPSVSGKNSPCFSGHNTPSGKNSPVAGKTSPGGKISPRVSITSPKGNIEFFASKVVAGKQDARTTREVTRLSDIKEKVVLNDSLDTAKGPADDAKIVGKEVEKKTVADAKLDEATSPNGVATEDPDDKDSKTISNVVKHKVIVKNDKDISSQAKATIAQLNAMECSFLEKQWIENSVKNENIMNKEKEEQLAVQDMAKTDEESSESPIKSDDNFADVSGESNNDEHQKGDFKRPETPKKTVVKETNSNNCVNPENPKEVDEKTLKENMEILSDKESRTDSDKKEVKVEKARPAYSQAAAKPKLATTQPKPDIKTQIKSTPIVRSKTVVEMRPSDKGKYQKKNSAKCSYPFNLTTGRTSLFDGVQSKSPGVRKLTIKPTIANRKEVNKPPLKTVDKEKEKLNPQLEKLKDFDEYSSSDTIVTQIDMSRIESSESLRTLIADEINDTAGSIEVLNMNSNDNDGWLTVRSRRLSREAKKPKSHWSNRFNQPSATTSLPTLNMSESPKDRAKSEQKEKKPQKAKERKTSMIRQKSDVTGLKTRPARNKAAKKERLEDKEECDATVRLHSSLESLTGLSRSQESAEDEFDFDKWKAEFKLYSKYLEEDEISDHKEILSTADPSEMSEIAEMTSQIEENERKISIALDFQSEVDQRKLCAEEDSLNRQIMELQRGSDVDLDTETDETETDLELPAEEPAAALGPLAASLEEQYESALRGMSWAERVDTLVALEALVARDPGRAQQLHAKLSQGIKRRGSLQDALRRLQAKQSRAESHRRELRTERSRRIQTLLARVEEVKIAKNQIIEDKRARMERRLKKAAENRDQHIKDIVRKAHDEEEKLREIAFIKQLDAENRRHELLEQCRSHNSRLRGMRREQLARLEQKSAREAAVGARRLALEEARRQHVESLLEKRKERDARVEGLKELKKQERDDAAREKAEGIKSRLTALALAAQESASLLRSRISAKQRATQLRRAQCMQARGVARHQTTSESQEQPTTEEEEQDRATRERKERERQKAVRKRARKLRAKLMHYGDEFEALSMESIGSMPLGNTKFGRIMNQINNIIHYITRNVEIKKDINQNGAEGPEKRKRKKRISDYKNNTDTCSCCTHDKDNCKETNKENKRDAKNETKDKEIEEKVDIEDKPAKVRKREKRESMSDKQEKLSKSSSIASSLSDMSKISGKSDKKIMLNIDWFHVEKLINELHRLMDKIDKKDQEMLVYGLKSLTQMLLLTADREENGVQFTTKSLSATVSILTRVVVTCPQAAAYFVSINASVHLATILSLQLDKDLAAEEHRLELQLARRLADCLAACFRCVCRTARGQPVHWGHDGRGELRLLADCRARAHGIISYMCLTGVVSKASEERARGALASTHALLADCLDMCLPCDLDTGQERQTAAVNLLAALGRDLGGARPALCAAAAAPCAAPCALAARLALAAARLDHSAVQSAFGEGRWPLEFSAAVHRLLAAYAPTDSDAPQPMERDATFTEEERESLVLDLISLVGYFVVNNEEHQRVCGRLLQRLHSLPGGWLVGPQRRALLPALAAFTAAPAPAAPAGSTPAPAPAAPAAPASDIIDDYLRSESARDDRLVQIILDTRRKKRSAKK